MPRRSSEMRRQFSDTSGYDTRRIGKETAASRLRRLGRDRTPGGRSAAERNDNIAVVGIATRNAPQHDSGLPVGARWLAVPDGLRDLTPDLVVEAVGRTAVEPWGLASLRWAPAFVVSSTSAFSDDAVLQRLVDEAERCGSQILIPSGALAGLDALAAASRLPLECVTHRIVKPRAPGKAHQPKTSSIWIR